MSTTSKKKAKKSTKTKKKPKNINSTEKEFNNLKTELDSFNKVLKDIQDIMTKMAVNSSAAKVSENKQEYVDMINLFKSMIDRSD